MILAIVSELDSIACQVRLADRATEVCELWLVTVCESYVRSEPRPPPQQHAGS